MIDDRVHHGLHLVRLRDIARHGDRFRTAFGQLAGNGLSGSGRYVDHGNSCAVVGQCMGIAAPNARAAPRPESSASI